MSSQTRGSFLFLEARAAARIRVINCPSGRSSPWWRIRNRRGSALERPLRFKAE